MKNIIKTLGVVSIMLIITSESFGQIFGIKAGLNLTKMLVKSGEDIYSDELKMKPGFHMGATAEFPIKDFFSFETGMILSTKGYKVYLKDVDFEFSSKVNLIYLDVPLNARVVYNPGFGRIYVALGPYIGIGIAGKSKYEETFNGESSTESETIEWGSDVSDNLKRFDFGLNIGAGIEIKAILIGLSYELGLANIYPSSGGGTKLQNRVLMMSVGYRFGAK